jgi:excinuclease ABC subunit C
MDDLFRTILDRTPTESGVYMMKNRQGKLVYIGKATNLRARLRQYFSGSDPRPFAKRLSKFLGDIETIITRNNKEAVLLENRLIKAHKPRYNIKLRDDKNYLSLRIDPRSPWPRVGVVRRQKKDGASYFGPYHSASAVRQTLRVLNRYFGLRTCTDSVLNNRSRPCLQYQIKRCPAPCVLDIDRASYDRSVREAVLFLQGKQKELVGSLKRRMREASEDQEYELAAHYRDQIRDVDRSLITQKIETVQRIDQDVFGLFREGAAVAIEAIFVRRGLIVGTRRFSFANLELPDEEVLSSLVMQYYTGGAVVPHEVLLPFELASTATFEAILTDLRGTKVRMAVPQRGNKKALLDTAQRNAEQAFNEEISAAEQRADGLEKLRQRLHLKVLPSRIECFDISNLGDAAVVGSQVVFQDGLPDKSSYRTYRVRQVVGQNDFAAMQEILSRRLRRSSDHNESLPDLMIIDGGKGQLNKVLAVLQDLGAHDLPVVGLAKARNTDRVTETGRLVRSDERVFLPGAKDPIYLRPNTAERHLMERIRDEAHRVAISYHKNLRRKGSLSSVLDRIPGVGPTRRTALLQELGSVKRIRASSIDDLTNVKGISANLAASILRALGAD